MTTLLERSAAAAVLGLTGFEVSAKRPEFDVPAVAHCDSAVGFSVKFPTTGFRVAYPSADNGGEDNRPGLISLIDGPVCERLQRGIKPAMTDNGNGSSMPKHAAGQLGGGEQSNDDGLIKKARRQRSATGQLDTEHGSDGVTDRVKLGARMSQGGGIVDEG